MRISNTVQIFKTFTFGKKNNITQSNISSQKNRQKDSGTNTADTAAKFSEPNNANEMKILALLYMPQDVFYLYRLSKKLSKAIAEDLPKVKSKFENTDAAVIFYENGEIKQIYNIKTSKDNKAQQKHTTSSNYDSSKPFANKRHSNGIILDGNNVAQIEEIRIKNKQPASAILRDVSGKSKYKIIFKEGQMSRFEFSKMINKNEQMIQILNFEKGTPKSYIRFECPTEDISTKSMKWIKFYDLNNGVWIATPPDILP